MSVVVLRPTVVRTFYAYIFLCALKGSHFVDVLTHSHPPHSSKAV